MDSICNLFVFVLFLAFVHSFRVNDVQKMSIEGKIKHFNFNYNNVQYAARNELPSKSLGAHHRILDNLLEMDSTKKHASIPKLGGTFKWNTCDGSDASLINIKDLNVTPDPLHFPSVINFEFSAIIKETIDAPLVCNLTVQREITPSFWLKIPCFNGVGSCDYDDLCATLEGATCPDPFVKYNIPCKCPFSKGNYKMQKSGIKIDVNGIPGGNYSIKANLTSKNVHVACLEIYFAISEQ